YLDKPPLMYWLVMLSYRLFGVCPEAARLVPALCVHATILGVYGLGRRSIGSTGALWAAMLLTAAPLFIGVARLLLLDGLLTFCITLSMLTGFEAVRTGQFRRSWWIAAALFSGLGFLTKGPISEVLLFPPLFAAGWLTGRLARVGLKDLALFGLIVFGVNLPWYIAMYQQEPQFLKYFFWQHNVMRFVQPFDHLQPVWYYFPLLFVGFLPAAPIIVSYLRSFWRGTDSETPRTPAGGYWLLAGLWCMFFFSVSGSKLPTYILPAFPPLCLALGEFISRSHWQANRWPRLLFGSFAMLMLIVHAIGLPWYAEARSPVRQAEMVQSFIGEPATAVASYPRDCNSVAYLLGRSDFDTVRSKDVNELMVAMHHRPRTVVLFTHRHSYEAF
ncbi:MAG: glycosyltransferase family 39 protein, partial [Gemmataceae bacterium]